MTDSKTQEPIKRSLKKAIRTALMGKTQVGDKVFLSRSVPTQYEEEFVILIFSMDEAIDRFNEAPKDYKRNMTVRIEAVGVGNDDDDLDAKLELVADRIERLMEIDETLGGLANKLELSGSEYRGDGQAQSPMGLLALIYNLEFFTDANRSTEEAIPNFNLVAGRMNVKSEAEGQELNSEQSINPNEEGEQ
jgi:hypothetical protein